ncbi:unnamed protein product, partial [Porites evermanni]
SNTSANNIRQLQGVQNFAHRIVSGTRKFDHVSPALKDLRWIPAKSHLYLRDAILAFKSMTGQLLRMCVILAPAKLSIRGADQKDRLSGCEHEARFKLVMAKREKTNPLHVT